MHGMADARCKHDGRAALGEPVPVAYDIADQLALIHALDKLSLDVIPALDANPGQIWPRGRIDDGWNKEPALYQLCDRRPFNQYLEGIAETAPIAPARRCGNPDDDGIRVGIQQIAVCARRGMMRLIDKDDLSLGQLNYRGPDRPAMRGPNRGDLHGFIRAMRKAGQQNAVFDTGCVELGAGLCD